MCKTEVNERTWNSGAALMFFNGKKQAPDSQRKEYIYIYIYIYNDIIRAI